MMTSRDEVVVEGAVAEQEKAPALPIEPINVSATASGMAGFRMDKVSPKKRQGRFARLRNVCEAGTPASGWGLDPATSAG